MPVYMSSLINSVYIYICHAPLTEHRALRHKLKSCTLPFLYRSDLVKSRRMLYSPDVCNCTIAYVPRTVPANAVRDPAYTAEVVALTLVEIKVLSVYRYYHWCLRTNVTCARLKVHKTSENTSPDDIY